VRAVVRLHVSTTLMAVLPVLPVKNFIYARGLLHAKLRSIISYRYLMLLCQHRVAGRSVAKIQRTMVINAHRLLRDV